jgi:hypothetical protein
MTINRRTFQKTLLLALGGAAVLSPFAVQAATRTPTHRHRFRYFRKGSRLSFWLRVAKPRAISADVPFTFLLSIDAGGQNVIQRMPYVARALSSHVVRGSFDLRGTGWTSDTPLFGRVLFTEEGVATRVRRLNAHRPNRLA